MDRHLLQRPRFDVAGAVDRKIALAPSLNVVGGDGGFDIPL